MSTEIKHTKAKKIVLGIAIIIIVLAAFASDRYIAANKLYAQAIEFEEAGKVADAKNAYISVLSMNPWHADANYQLAVLLEKEGSITKAIELMNRAASIRKSPDYFVGLGYLYLNRANNKEKAEEHFKAAYKLDNKNYYACYMLGTIAEDKHDTDTAIQYYERTIGLNARSAASYRHLAVLYESMGMTKKAKSCWQVTIKLDPKDKDAQTHLHTLNGAD